jgi:hypothetical protein
MTHISQATLDEVSQAVKTTVLVNGSPVSVENPLPVDAIITVDRIESTSTVEIEVNNQPISNSNPVPVMGTVEVESVSLEVGGNLVTASNPLPVDITDVEIAIAINKDTDSVQVFQGEYSPGLPIPWQVESVSVYDESYLTANVLVGTSPVEMKAGTVRLSNRKLLCIHNKSENTIYIGPIGVTVSTGRPVFPDQSMDMPIGNMGIYAVANESGNSLIVQEIG